MLGNPKRLRTRTGTGFLVGRKHRIRTDSDEAARKVAQRLLADPRNIEALRSELGSPGASLDELESWLSAGLASNSFSVITTKPRPPVFEQAEVTSLVDLLPTIPEPEPEVRSWIAFQAVDSKRRPLPLLTMEVTDHAATDVTARADEDARARLDDLPSDELHTVKLHWGDAPSNSGEKPVPLEPSAKDGCWVGVALVDRKGCPVGHLDPLVDGAKASPQKAGVFLAVGLAESESCTVAITSNGGAS